MMLLLGAIKGRLGEFVTSEMAMLKDYEISRYSSKLSSSMLLESSELENLGSGALAATEEEPVARAGT